jgi:hypothetical protein
MKHETYSIVGSKWIKLDKFHPNGNYDKNNGFSAPQIENKTGNNTLFFRTRI